MDPSAVARLREVTPGCRTRNHLNNAGAGLMPQPVLDAVFEHLILEAEIGGYEAEAANEGAIRASYDAVAELVGCQRRNVAFVENATVAFAQALSAIPFESGDVILTSRDDYISNQLMYLSLAKRLGVAVHRVPNTAEGGVDVDALRVAVDELRPRLVAITHVPTNSGLIQPVVEIGAVCRDRDVMYLVDACQSVGQMPVDVGRIGCDFLSATCRKFLRGPRGAGFLFVSDRILGTGLEPLFIDMRGADWTDADAYERNPTAQRFENWEFAHALVLGSGAAASYALELGLDAIRDRTFALSARAREGLGALSGFEVLDRGTELAGIVTVANPAIDIRKLQLDLRDEGINTTVSERCYAVLDFDDKGVDYALRVSPHYYNTEDEIDALVAACADASG